MKTPDFSILMGTMLILSLIGQVMTNHHANRVIEAQKALYLTQPVYENSLVVLQSGRIGRSIRSTTDLLKIQFSRTGVYVLFSGPSSEVIRISKVGDTDYQELYEKFLHQK